MAVPTAKPIFQIGWPVLRPGGGHGPRKQCRSNATGSKSMGSSRSSSSRSQGGGLGRTAPPQPSLFRRTEPLALLWWPNRSSTPTWMITTGVPSMTRFLGSFKGAWPRRQSTALASRPPERRTARQIRQARSGHERGPRIPKFASDSPLEGTGFEPSVPRRFVCRFSFTPTFRLAGNQPEATLKDWLCHAGPMVRILFPPARSQQRTWMSAILPRQSRVDTLARTRARLGLTFWLSDCLKYTGRCCI